MTNQDELRRIVLYAISRGHTNRHQLCCRLKKDKNFISRFLNGQSIKEEDAGELCRILKVPVPEKEKEMIRYVVKRKERYFVKKRKNQEHSYGLRIWYTYVLTTRVSKACVFYDLSQAQETARAFNGYIVRV